MPVVFAVLAIWTLVVLCAVALCVQAARADNDADDVPVPAPASGRFSAVA